MQTELNQLKEMSALKLAQNLSRFRLITFDVTDTLLRFTRPPVVQYAKTASSFGYADIDQKKLGMSFRTEFKKMLSDHPNFGASTKGMHWKDWWIKLVSNIFTQAETNIPREDLVKIANKLMELYATEQCWVKIESADEIIDKIKSLNKTVGVISNFDPSLHDLVKTMKLPEFDFIVTSHEAKVSKPDPRIFEEALKKSGINKKQALHVGNTLLTDYLGALNAGWNSVHISNSSKEWMSNSAVNKDHVFSNLKTFLYALENKDIQWP